MNISKYMQLLSFQVRPIYTYTAVLWLKLKTFRQDNVAAVCLARYPVSVTCFDGKHCAGPVPVIFSSDPPATEVCKSNNVYSIN
jgi:hypothetical protein